MLARSVAQSKQRGFTLIELMIVCAILGIIICSMTNAARTLSLSLFADREMMAMERGCRAVCQAVGDDVRQAKSLKSTPARLAAAPLVLVLYSGEKVTYRLAGGELRRTSSLRGKEKREWLLATGVKDFRIDYKRRGKRMIGINYAYTIGKREERRFTGQVCRQR